MSSKILLEGNRAEAAKWIAFARNTLSQMKASGLPVNISRPLKSIFIRVSSIAGIDTIYIKAAGGVKGKLLIPTASYSDGALESHPMTWYDGWGRRTKYITDIEPTISFYCSSTGGGQGKYFYTVSDDPIDTTSNVSLYTNDRVLVLDTFTRPDTGAVCRLVLETAMPVWGKHMYATFYDTVLSATDGYVKLDMSTEPPTPVEIATDTVGVLESVYDDAVVTVIDSNRQISPVVPERINAALYYWPKGTFGVSAPLLLDSVTDGELAPDLNAGFGGAAIDKHRIYLTQNTSGGAKIRVFDRDGVERVDETYTIDTGGYSLNSVRSVGTLLFISIYTLDRVFVLKPTVVDGERRLVPVNIDDAPEDSRLVLDDATGQTYFDVLDTPSEDELPEFAWTVDWRIQK